MIALMARAHLTPEAAKAVDQLLRENPIDPELNRFCKDRPDDAMADAATWADDARNIEKTGDWHFIDIPLAVAAGSAPARDAMNWCRPEDGKPGCIVSAIDYEWGLLRDKRQPGPVRAKALRYVIHLVGDLSQPLHASDNHDRGGNCTEIGFFGEPKAENLHAIWDYKIIARELEGRKSTQMQYARELDESFAKEWPAWGQSKAEVEAWAWDSHRLAATVVYGELKPAIPVVPAALGTADQSGCAAEKASVAALHITIGEPYFGEAMPVIRGQLAKAGYRLAGMLNETFQ
jgi:hypothetical protein